MSLFTDEVLLEYVQQRLSSTISQQIELALQNDSALASRIQNLRRGELPYAAAFADESLPSVPSHLMEQVQVWSRLSLQSTAGEVDSKDAPKKSFFELGKLNSRWRALTFKGFCAGLVSSLGLSIILSFGLGVGVNSWLVSKGADDANSWTTAVAQYQRLYQRETLEGVNFDAAQTRKLLVDLQQRYGMNIKLPNLQSEGLELRRVQFLALAQNPIVQIVYMPKVGTPIALCATLSANATDQTVHHEEHSGQHMLVWRQQGISYLLIGVQSEQELRHLMPKLQSGLWS